MAVGPYWSYIAPVARDNLCLNPSFERGTVGVAAIQSATLGSAANEQQFGAWSCTVVPNSNGTSGAAFGTWTAGNGTDYTVSAHVRGVNGVAYMIGVGDSSGLNLVGSTAFTGGGTWQRYSYSYSESSGATRRVVIRKTSGNDTGTFYVDAVQIEAGSITTYMDGDQEGCSWLGAPHASTSSRSGQIRAGGSVIPLSAIGFTVDESLGIGMPQVENSAQSFAIVPGAEFQRQRARERVFTLTSYLSGTSWGDMHQQRKAAINAFNIDAFTPQQPTRFLYTGGLGTVQIDAVYDQGLEFGKPDGFTEVVAVRFVAYDPYWRATTDEGTALAPRANLGSVVQIALRNSLGGWGTLGSNGSTVEPTGAINAIWHAEGTLYIGGIFGTLGGTTSGALGFYTPANNRFGTLGGTVQISGVKAITTDAAGTVYFGGGFTNISGLSNTRFLARWDRSGGFGTLAGGTPNGAINALAWRGGTLCIGGAQSGVAGTTTGGLTLWTRSGYGSTTGGTINNEVFSIAVGLDQKIYVVTQGVTTAGGTSVNYVAQWNGAWGTLGTGFTGGGIAGGGALAVGPNGILYAGGGFGSAGGGSVNNTAQWNGVQWSPMSYGLGVQNPGIVEITSFFAADNGAIFAAGAFEANTGGRNLPDALAEWNGYTWLPLSVDFRQTTTDQVLQAPDKTLFVSGMTGGTATASAVGTIINTGISEAYPTLVIRNTSAATSGRIYEFSNTLTNDRIFFDYTLEPGEVATLDLTPGERSFTSNFLGTIFSKIIPGSNTATWRLLPGTNWVAFFSDNDSLVPSLYWRPRHESGDGGTVY